MTVIINGTTGIDTVQDGAITDNKLSLSANSQEIKDALNASGSAPIYACRAWVNFNGTGTVAISASGNVTSITDNGTGNYTLNLTTAMSDANYAVFFGICGGVVGASNSAFVGSVAAATQYGAPNLKSTTQVQIATNDYTATSRDFTQIYVAIFR